MAINRQKSSTRHKCFISYHDANRRAVEAFINRFSDVIIPRTVGVTATDPFVNSTDQDYVKRVIREKYLTDSTVTIVLIGRCTWARRFVDWEIASSLRNDPNNKRSGLLGIKLSSEAKKMPARLNANISSANKPGYARVRTYPRSAASLRRWVEDAFDARSTRQGNIDNSLPLRQRNSPC